MSEKRQSHEKGMGNEKEKRKERRGGVVLFVVTVVITLASLAAYGFLATMQGESKASRVVGDQLQVAQVGASGEEFLAVWLQASRAQRSTIKELYGDTIFTQAVTEPTLGTETISAGQFHIVVPNNVGDLGATTPFQSTAPQPATFASSSTALAELDSGYPFRYGVTDESAKLHLRTLLAWDVIWPGSARNALLKLPAMTPSTADAILDWIDDDNETREFGAESEYYSGLVPPVSVPNAIPRSIDDLLRVRGVTRSVLLGRSANNGANDQANDFGAPQNASNFTSQSAAGGTSSPTNGPFSSASTAGSVATRPWTDFLTVYSAERNESYDGSERINLNNPELAELHSELLGQFPQDLADFVIYFRQFGPVADGDDNNTSNNDIATSSAKIFAEQQVDFSLPAEFKFTSVGQLIDAIVLLPADDDAAPDDPEPLVASPLSVRNGPNPEFSNWLDRLTVRARKVIIGRLNILAADPIVISALPVPDQSVATQIVAARNTQTLDATMVPGISWLLTDELVDREIFSKLARFLTTGGDVARFQVVATHPYSPLVDRFEVILDGTVKNTQRVHFRDLRRESRPGMFEMFPQQPATTTPPTALTQNTTDSP